MPTNAGEQSQVLARSVVRPRYKAELAPVVFSRADDKQLEIYKSDGKTPLDTPADVVEHEGKNPLTPYLESSIEKSPEDRGDNARELDESFEEHLTAVLGPSNRPTKRRKTGDSNDKQSSITTSPLTSHIEDTSNTSQSTHKPHSSHST